MLPAVANIQYNGYTFNGTARSRLVGTPVYDRAGRRITHTEYALAVTWLVYESSAGAGCATLMEEARYKLQEPGGVLVYKDNGFGDLEINSGSIESDLVWGPKPQKVEAKPVGCRACWELTWTCTFAISECTFVNLHNGSELPIMAFNFAVDYSIDEMGLTTRTYNGYLQVPTTEHGGMTADDFRERLAIPVPVGFKRVNQNFRLDEAKTTLNFTVIDQEVLAEGLAVGCVESDGQHSIRNTGPMKLNNWNGRIAAQYTVAPNQERRKAWDAFWALCRDRLKATIDFHQEQAQQNNGPNNQKAGLQPFIVGLEFTEGLYQSNRHMSFELTYTFISPFKDIVKASGIWRPVPNTDPAEWMQSVGDLYHPRGLAKLRFDPQTDVLIDLCDQGEPRWTEDQSENQGSSGEDADILYGSGGYLAYQNQIEVIGESGYSPARLLTDNDRRYWGGIETKADVRPYESATLGQELPNFVPEPPDNVEATESIQARNATSFRVRMYGYAARVWKPIPAPKLKEYGGKKAIPIGEQNFKQRRVGELMGTPIYQATWDQEYWIDAADVDPDFYAIGDRNVDTSLPGFENELVTNGLVPPEFAFPEDPQ
jgi:hypothetical protein